ncbi:DUF6106 family protein [Clostridium sp. D53t1_180928_C8]|uniref:DUF6106 family protein n=1 Tax=Clostridium sp. D53t1_180928_C8 TaxID=2787101 RepID=UPI0018AA862F
MEEVFEQFIECDKRKTTSNILKGLSMVFFVLSAFFLTISLLVSIVMGVIALALFILSFLSYVEYEYELFNDTINISKIYNESRRKTVKSISIGDIRKVYENNTNNKKNNKVFYNSNIKGLSVYTFELNDNTKIELALNDKLKRRIGIVYAQKIVRQF